MSRVPKAKMTGGKRKTIKMKETIVSFSKGPFPKKYTARIKNNKTKSIRTLHFGDRRYEQFKDRTNLGIYTKKNHNDKRRQNNYYNRHSGVKNRKKAIHKEKINNNGYYTPKILSHVYLW